MHELSYVLKIIDCALQCAKENDLKEVKELSVEVGAMTGALPEYLNMYFKKAALNTCLEGAKLNITNIPVLAECRCGNIYKPEKENGYCCTKCGDPSGRIVQGRDIVVVSVSGNS